MAAQLLAPATSATSIVDLTTPEDEVVDTLCAPETRSSTPPLPAYPSSRLRNPNGTFVRNGQLTLPTRETQENRSASRPMKRRRTGEVSPRLSSQERRRQDVAAALGRCLEQQVFPHVERATGRLPNGIYDLDKLGAKVIRAIVDKDFERHFHEGHGRLSSARESIIAAGVHRLVIEFAANPDYRLPTHRPSHATTTTTTTTNAATPTTLPSILPSIEKEPDDDLDGNHQMYIESDDFDDLKGPLKQAQRPRLRTPQRPKRKKHQVSPQQLRARAKAKQWQSGKPYESSNGAAGTQHHLFNLPIRPYLSAQVREQIILGVPKAILSLESSKFPQSQVFHVDFSNAEISYLQTLARTLYGRPAANGQRSTLRDLRNILKKIPDMRAVLVEIHRKGYDGYNRPPLSLKKRSPDDIMNFLHDLHNRKLNLAPQSLFIEHSNSVARSEASRATQVSALLLTREITGNRLGGARTYQNFTTAVKSNREDYLEPQVEWTNCAGDIMTVSWLSNTDFICGTTTHSDSHNQQYNKPGNLLLGSAMSSTLRAYPDHRIVRPIVSNGDNALASMVASQDPWLFTSVVSSDYDPSCGLAFTSSFDKTVKIWQPQNGSMAAVGTWKHEGRVNFVVASKNNMGTVATAADVPTAAVRVYHLNRFCISDSLYDSYSCTRVHDEDYVPSEKWAYYPAAIRWGLAHNVRHLLLIGYSPRSLNGEDHEIPEDKLDTGELCLWDTVTKTQVKVNSAKTQNVFEVAWHPSRASFAAATSASQTLEKFDQAIRTQIRIFELNETGQYGAIKTLDCVAIDINELSIMPNSLLYSYVAASCTDGNVYVWDTAGSDLPMCVLEHGNPVEELIGEREKEDVGVKFTAWATTADRLYTGSSDGVVKVWNIRHGNGVLVKDLIEVAAPITFGAFSPDFTRLVIGDGSGRVYLLALEDPEDEDPPETPAGVSAGFLNVQLGSGKQRTVRRPRPFLPHPELPPPNAQAHHEPFKAMDGQEKASEFLKTAQLVLHPDPTVGAVQGANYAQTGLFRAEAHVNEDVNEPLLDVFKSNQQVSQPSHRASRSITRFSHQQRQDNGLTRIDSSENWDIRGQINPWPSPADYDSIHVTHDTWLELKKEKAELDDSLIELNYETSILDSDEDEK
ncbi:WD40 repeat-like protein [Xylariaceae sp. FL1651]|nr:WD40 repeat-like protein [Xylariaceae sp. FL1651]